MNKTAINKLNTIVFDAAAEVYKQLGPGLSANIYKACLCKELDLRNVKYHRNALFPIYYKQYELDADLQVDILIENELILKVLATENILFSHQANVKTSLNLTKRRIGIIINFNVPNFIDGFKKIVN